MLFLGAHRCLGQGSFINLDFERANLSAYGAGPAVVPATNGIPSWTPVSILGTDRVLYNDVFLGAAGVSVFGIDGPFSVIDGAFSVQLYGGGGTPTGASISQTSLVPVDANSILFKAQGTGSLGGPLLVSLGGENVPFSVISTTPDYTAYGGDVSAFAGQTAQLTFTAPPGVNNYWTLDDIQFSSSSIPEPSSFSLSAIGALLLGWRALRRPAQRTAQR